jgi:hypothetical protein
MKRDLKYGEVALGVEAGLPFLIPDSRRRRSCASLRRKLTWLYAALKRWA